MKTIDLKMAKKSLASYARKVGEPLVVTDGRKVVAALVPLGEGDVESLSLGTNPEFLALLERSRARLKAEGGISSSEMRRRLGLPPSKAKSPKSA